MTRWLKLYAALFRAHFGIAVAYRAQIVIWILTGVLPLLMMVIWITIAEQRPDGLINGFDRTAFISYYLAVVIVRRLCGVWIIWDLDEDIRLGQLSFKLLRPLDPFHQYFVMGTLSEKPVEFTLVFPPVALAAWLLGAQYSQALGDWLLVPIAIFGAICIEFFVSMAVGMAAFWITQAVSLMQVWFYVRSFLSGWLIPLAMFPAALQATFVYLPFRYTLSFPLEILLGQLSPAEIALGFTIQWGWIALLFTLYRLLWRNGLKHFSAVGA